MASTWLIPKRRAYKTKRPGGGGQFWADYWNGFDDARGYAVKVHNHKATTSAIVSSNLPEDVRLYAEVKLNPRAKSKTSRPQEVWKATGLEVVASHDDTTFTISGYKDNFARLDSVLAASSFQSAKSGAGIPKREMNVYREVFAVDTIEDKNVSIDGRLSRELQRLLQDPNTRSLDCLIEIYSDQNLSDYDKLFSQLDGDPALTGAIQKRNREFFFGNMSFRGLLTGEQINLILRSPTFNFVYKVKHYPRLVAQRCVPTLEVSSVSLGDYLTNETVGIIDSGIEHPLLDGLVVQKYNHIQRHRVTDTNHGTFVASRLTFGHEVFGLNGSEVNPLGKILDIRVLCRKDQTSNEVIVEDMDVLKGAIAEAINRHNDVSIYNLSINDKTQIDEQDIDEFTEFLDQIVYQRDVIIVCSVGNHDLFPAGDYQSIFSDPSLAVKIAPPGDALNVISVGSIAHIANEETLCPEVGHPSPFTRKGGIRADWKKPEFVEKGGNVKKDESGVYQSDFQLASSRVYGVEGLTTSGFQKDIGTSFSAPIVARECALLLDYIKKSNFGSLLDYSGNKLNLIKTLLVHSTGRIQQALVENEDLKRAVGFGVPGHEAVIHDIEDEATLVYCDKIEYEHRKHRLVFRLPESLLGKPVDFLFTLSYNPPVDKNYPDEYKMITLMPSLGLQIPTVDEEGNPGKPKYKALSKSHSWENYKNKKYNTHHLRVSTRSLKSLDVEIQVQMSVSEKYEKKYLGRENELVQPYSLALTVIDKEQQGTLRNELLLTQQFEQLVENSVSIQV